mgnify:CR=1 FL=1
MYSCLELDEIPTFSSIGRYNENDNTYDVIFNREYSDKWKQEERHEYHFGEYGYYNNWTYNLSSMYIRNLVMKWINEIPENNRNKINVVRYMMSKISYDNSGDESLLVGNWSGNYSNDGRHPTFWMNSNDIFHEQSVKSKPVKYGQCWCFAECMTSICRFLGIACRTISGKNTLLDANLDNGIDFNEDLRKGDTSGFILIEKENLNRKLSNLSNGTEDKGDILDNLKIYDSGDSYWNIHYWNEVFIDGEWWIIDSTPIVESKSNDEYNGMKFLGPTRVSSFKNTTSDIDFNFKNIFSMVNSPYRLWTTETIVENDEIVSIPYVYSIIYPHNKHMSVFLNTKNVTSLFNMKSKITTRISGKKQTLRLDISENYEAPSNILQEIYFNDMNFEGNFYVQVVYLNSLGAVLNIKRTNDKILSIDDFINDEVEGCYIVSYLFIEKTDKNPRWITFLKYK